MTQKYQRILAAVDGSKEAELAFEKAVNVALRNKAQLILAHIIDTRALQSVVAFDASVYERLEKEANELLDGYEQHAREVGVEDIKRVIELGNPKTLLATEIPEKEGVDLIMLGATGLNTFERLLIGSSSEYIMRHAKVDLLIVRDTKKVL